MANMEPYKNVKRSWPADVSSSWLLRKDQKNVLLLGPPGKGSAALEPLPVPSSGAVEKHGKNMRLNLSSATSHNYGTSVMLSSLLSKMGISQC